MTRRERLERKLALREEWAEKRRAKAAAVAREGEKYRGDIAFNTQPGHIPERARLIKREERAFEDLKMAQHHESRAAGVAAQLDRSVFSDDSDAIEQLEARIAEREAEAEKNAAINRAWRKSKGDVAALVASGLVGEALAKTIADTVRVCPYLRVPLDTTNLRASIRRDRERIEEVRARQSRAEEAKAAGGVVVKEVGEDECECGCGRSWHGSDPAMHGCSLHKDACTAWRPTGHKETVRVTFAEKPDRAVLDALKAVGFWWTTGSWQGKRAALPKEVKEMIAPNE